MQAINFERSVIALAIAGAFATGAVVADRVGLNPALAAPTPAAVAAPGTAIALPNFADLVATHGPAVVQISTMQSAEKVSAQGGRGMPDLSEMFPNFRGLPRPQMPDQGPMQGMGSGFIVSPD